MAYNEPRRRSPSDRRTPRGPHTGRKPSLKPKIDISSRPPGVPPRRPPGSRPQGRPLGRPKKPVQIFEFRPGAPRKLVRHDAVFTIYDEKIPISWGYMMVTFLLILVGGLGTALIQAHIANTNRDIRVAQRELRAYRDTTFALESQLEGMYTWGEIERIASERLGMAVADPAQIINIYVPRQSGVVLNTDFDAIPSENYFWQEITGFFRDIVDRIFGG